MQAVTTMAGQGHKACRWLVGLALAMLVLVSPQVARAQFGMMGGMGGGAGELTQMAVTRDSMSRYCEVIGMAGAERELALELHAGYMDSYKQMSEKFKRHMERMQREFQETRDLEVFQKQMPAVIRDITKRMEELEEGIFSDLRTLANIEETDERWVRVERMRRREQARFSTMISGDAVDLVAVVGDLEGVGDDVPQPVAESLLRYEAELDSVLLERERLMKEMSKKNAEMMESLGDPETQMELGTFWQEFMTKTQELGRRAKAINARYASEIERLLEGEPKVAFDREVKRLTWPLVYRTAYPERLLDVAEGMSDVTDQQKEQLATIRREYSASAALINARWAQLVDEREEKAEGFMGMYGFGEEDQTDEAKARGEREELDKGTAERIRAVLTPQQQERLPGEYDFDLGEQDDG